MTGILQNGVIYGSISRADIHFYLFFTINILQRNLQNRTQCFFFAAEQDIR